MCLELGAYRFVPQLRGSEHGQRRIGLSRLDYELALCLYRKMRKVGSRESLESRTGASALAQGSRALNMHMSRLRTTLGLCEVEAALSLRTVYGQGYCLEERIP